MHRGIRTYPDPVLRTEAEPVEVIDQALRALAADMIETMYADDGVGLAGPQVGESLRIIAVDVCPDRNGAEIYINPEILSATGRISADEGCLSLPGLLAEVERAERVTVAAQRLDGEEVTLEAEGLAARAFQHEIDHLDGVLFIDKVDPVERLRLRGELQQLEAEYRARIGHES
jgi:peptide deformylase